MAEKIALEIFELKEEIQNLLNAVMYIPKNEKIKLEFFNELFEFKMEMLNVIEKEYQAAIYQTSSPAY